MCYFTVGSGHQPRWRSKSPESFRWHSKCS